MSVTNLEVGLVKKVPAQIIEEGEICVPAKTLLDLVSSLQGEKIELEGDPSSAQLKVSTLNLKAVLNGIAALEFPPIPLSAEGYVDLDAPALKTYVPQIAYASATDEGRPVLTGILTQIQGKTLELVATDGFRLAHKKAKLENEGALKAVVPRKTLEEIVRLIEEEKEVGQIKIAASENQNQIIFKIGQTDISSRLIEGQFPAWEKIIPKEFQNRTVLDKTELLKAVKLSSVFAKDAANITKITSSSSGVLLNSQTKEVGSQETKIDAQVEGQAIEIAFNSRFLIDALSACPSSQVSLEFSGNLSAAMIKPVGEEDLEYIIMPVRLN